MKPIFRSWFRARQSRIRRRLDKTKDTATVRPVLSGRPIDYDVSHRHRAIAHGGIGVIHTLAHLLGLPQAIDQHLHLLKVHLPYHESDHVGGGGRTGKPFWRCTARGRRADRSAGSRA